MQLTHALQARRDSAPKSIFARIAALGNSVQIITVQNAFISQDKIRAIRHEFDGAVKSDFYGWLAKNRTAEFRKIFRLDDYDIAKLQIHGLFGLARGKQGLAESHNASIDHIVPIYLGGTNDYKNLCMMPDWLNSLKARFESFQCKDNPKISHIQTIAPPLDEDGQYKKIVTVPGFCTPRR